MTGGYIRSADILAEAIVAPYDSLIRRERDSGISKFTINKISQDAKFHQKSILGFKKIFIS